jgi:antitoxin ParD1/3/4
MVMTITLELPPHLEGQLRDSVARGDAEAVQRLLAEALAPAVTALLNEATPPLSDAEFEALADQLAEDVAARAGEAAGWLSDAAVSREGIYEDHP